MEHCLYLLLCETYEFDISLAEKELSLLGFNLDRKKESSTVLAVDMTKGEKNHQNWHFSFFYSLSSAILDIV